MENMQLIFMTAHSVVKTCPLRSEQDKNLIFTTHFHKVREVEVLEQLDK